MCYKRCIFFLTVTRQNNGACSRMSSTGLWCHRWPHTWERMLLMMASTLLLSSSVGKSMTYINANCGSRPNQTALFKTGMLTMGRTSTRGRDYPACDTSIMYWIVMYKETVVCWAHMCEHWQWHDSVIGCLMSCSFYTSLLIPLGALPSLK